MLLTLFPPRGAMSYNVKLKGSIHCNWGNVFLPSSSIGVSHPQKDPRGETTIRLQVPAKTRQMDLSPMVCNET